MQFKSPTRLYTLTTKVQHGNGHECKAWVATSSIVGRDDLVFGFEAHCGWFLSDFLHNDTDRIAIDFGQGWYITNKKALASEISEWLCADANAAAIATRIAELKAEHARLTTLSKIGA